MCSYEKREYRILRRKDRKPFGTAGDECRAQGIAEYLEAVTGKQYFIEPVDPPKTEYPDSWMQLFADAYRAAMQ